MLLRRIIEHVKTQNWTAVGLDFVIVVVGVLLAFQITAWNDDRINRIDETGYLERLHKELESSISLIGEDVAQLAEWHSLGKQNIAILESGRLAEADVQSFERGLVVGFRLEFVQSNLATVDELLSSGRLGIIRNAEIRAGISRVSSVVENMQSYIRFIGERQNMLTPILWTRVRWVQTIDIQGATVVDYDFERLTADDEFIFAYGNAVHILRTNQMWLSQASEEIAALRDLVGAELNRD